MSKFNQLRKAFEPKPFTKVLIIWPYTNKRKSLMLMSTCNPLTSQPRVVVLSLHFFVIWLSTRFLFPKYSFSIRNNLPLKKLLQIQLWVYFSPSIAASVRLTILLLFNLRDPFTSNRKRESNLYPYIILHSFADLCSFN